MYLFCFGRVSECVCVCVREREEKECQSERGNCTTGKSSKCLKVQARFGCISEGQKKKEKRKKKNGFVIVF